MSEAEGLLRFFNKHPRPLSLEAVIEEIRQEYLCTDQNEKSVCPMEKCIVYDSCLGKWVIRAIRILEAAGRVDKEECMAWFRESSDLPMVVTEMLKQDEMVVTEMLKQDKWGTTYNSRRIRPQQEIYDLLESLPDKEEK